ncbi:unnamed protein product [Discosporangium mesarthrocarpum]
MGVFCCSAQIITTYCRGGQAYKTTVPHTPPLILRCLDFPCCNTLPCSPLVPAKRNILLNVDVSASQARNSLKAQTKKKKKHYWHTRTGLPRLPLVCRTPVDESVWKEWFDRPRKLTEKIVWKDRIVFLKSTGPARLVKHK